MHYGIWGWSLLALEWTPIFTSQSIVFSLYSIVGVGVTGPPLSTNWIGRVFQAISSVMKILKHIWDLYLINPIIIYWVWASFYWENQRHICLYHCQMRWINPFSRVSLSRTGRTPEWRLSIKMINDINDENNYCLISVIDHIAKMKESLVSYQIIGVFGRA